MGNFDKVVYAKIIKLERDGQWSPEPDITYYKFKIEVQNKVGRVFKGRFFQRFIKEVEELEFKLGEWRICELDGNKIKPIE